MDEIVVTPDMVMPILRGDLVLDETDGVVVCEDMPICRLKDGVLEAVACANAAHGVHRRSSHTVENLKRVLQKYNLEYSTQCNQCEDGWLNPKSPIAAQQVLLAAVFGIFRGVILPKEDLLKNYRLNLGEINELLGIRFP